MARVVPAHERLDADDAAGHDVGLGLVVQLELLVLERGAQLAGEREAARRVVVLLRLVEREAAAGLLGRVHGDVGALDQDLDVVAVVGVAGDADRAAHLERQPVDHERLAQRGLEDLGHRLGVVGAEHVGQQHAELVAAEAGHGVGGAQRRLEALGDLLEQHVAVVMAERVVDLLEVVEVHDHHGRAAVAALGGAHGLLDAVAEQHAVREAGERVVQRLVLLGDRLAAAAVDRQQRQEQQRQHGEREVGGDHEHRREAEQQAGGRGLEEEVGGEVAPEADALGERDRAGDEARVQRVEDEGGRDDARQVARARGRSGRAGAGGR